jgi:hypothetical protein
LALFPQVLADLQIGFFLLGAAISSPAGGSFIFDMLCRLVDIDEEAQCF